MRKVLMLVAVLVLAFPLVGCGVLGGSGPGAKPEIGPGPGAKPEIGPGSGAKPEILIGTDKVPKESLQWIESQVRTKQVVRKTFGLWDVYVVAMGEQRTGGYAVKIDNTGFDSGKTWVIDVKFIEPAPGQMVTQALTYPYEVFAVPKGATAKVRLIDKNGRPTELQIKAG